MLSYTFINSHEGPLVNIFVNDIFYFICQCILYNYVYAEDNIHFAILKTILEKESNILISGSATIL